MGRGWGELEGCRYPSDDVTLAVQVLAAPMAHPIQVHVYTHWSVDMACSVWSNEVNEEGCAGWQQLRHHSQQERASRGLENQRQNLEHRANGYIFHSP